MPTFFYGSFMRGQPGHANLDGATFVEDVRTAPRYRLYSQGDHPELVEADDGVAIAGQLFEVPAEVWPRILAAEPEELHTGQIELDDGRRVDGLLGDAPRGEDISAYGGWAAYRLS